MVVIFKAVCTTSILEGVTRMFFLDQTLLGPPKLFEEASNIWLLCLSLCPPILARALLGQCQCNPVPSLGVSEFPPADPYPSTSPEIPTRLCCIQN